MKLEKWINEKKRLIKFKIIDKLDMLNSRNTIKNLHNYFFILSYINDNIDFYYHLKYKISKDEIDKERIEHFENLLKDMNIFWILDYSIIVQDEDWIKSIEKINISYLEEKGFI